MPRVFHQKSRVFHQINIPARSYSPDVEDNPFEDNGSAGGTDPPEQEAHQHEQVIDAVSFDRSEGKNEDCDSGSQAEDNPLNFQGVDEFLFYSEEEQQESDGLDDKPDNNGFGDGAAVQGESGDVPAGADGGGPMDAIPVAVGNNADDTSVIGSADDNDQGDQLNDNLGSGPESTIGGNSPECPKWPGYRVVELYNVDDPSQYLHVNVPFELESCGCDAQTGFWCADYLFGVDLVTLCRAINLDPRETIQGLEVQYPWSPGGISNDGALPSEMDFEKREEYKSNPDPCAWDNQVHSLGVFQLHATPRNQLLRLGLKGRELPGWIAPVDEDAPNPVENPKPLDIRPIHPSTDCEDSADDEGEESAEDEGNASEDDCNKAKPSGLTFNMYEESRHNEIFYYLLCNQLPTRLNGKGPKMNLQRKQFRQNANRRYQLDTINVPGEEATHKLYYLNGAESVKRKQERTPAADARKHIFRRRYVPRADEIEAIIAKDHTHSGHNAAEMRLRDQYMIVNLRKRVNAVHADNCPICDKFKPIKKIPTRAILTSRRLQLVQFDLTKFYVTDEEGYQWILVVVDHFTKYCWAQAFLTKESLPIAEFLADLFMHNGVPERWHADNGGEFTSAHIDAAREVLVQNVNDPIRGKKLTYSHGMPRNPRCQGLVERLNQTLKTRIHKQLMEKGYQYKKDAVWDWRPTLKKVVFELNRTHVKLYGVSPHILLYGFAAEAPDHRPLRPEQHARLHLHCANQQRKAASKKGALDTPTYFDSGDAVMVHALKERRSHHDLVGKNAVPWPATATIVCESSTNRNYYKIKWTSRGIDGKKKGEVAHQLWPHWCLKKWLTGPGKYIAGFPIKGERDEDSSVDTTSEDLSDGEDVSDRQDDHVSLMGLCHAILCLWHM
jgi:transposase InsO family protein